MVAKKAAHSRAATTLAAVNVRGGTRRAAPGATPSGPPRPRTRPAARPRRRGTDRGGGRPAAVDALVDGVDDRHELGRHAQRPGEVGGAALLGPGGGHEDQHEAISAAPMGTLTRKIHSQPGPSANSPPAMTPIDAAAATDRSEDAQCLVPQPPLGERAGEDRQAAGAASAGLDALQRTGGGELPEGFQPAPRRARRRRTGRARRRACGGAPNRSAARPPSRRKPPSAMP